MRSPGAPRRLRSMSARHAPRPRERPVAVLGEKEQAMDAKHPALVWSAVGVGLALIALAAVYWVEPAGSLPSFLPGHEAGSGHHHVKHGIAAFLVGAALLVYAWFQTGKEGGKQLTSS